MSQTERLYWIDSQIRSRRFPNANAICEEFGVSRRTAYSDRDILKERLNAPLVYDRSQGGWRYSDSTYVLPFLALTEPEAKALARSMLTAREYLGSADVKAIEQIVARLGEYVPGSNPISTSVSGSLHSSPDVSVSPQLLSDCENAVSQRQRLHILYYSAHRNELTERVVHPYHLHNHQGEWHLIGWCEWRKSPRQFFLGRVREWRLLAGDGAYRVDPNFDAAEYLSHGFGAKHGEELVTVHLRFSAHQARWIRERIYHQSQQLIKHEDGSLDMSLVVAGVSEIQRWILSYGNEVEVLQPLSLRDQVSDVVKKTSEIYVK